MIKQLFGLDRKTFKPLKGHKIGSKQAQLSEQAKATLGTGNMAEAVKLPEGADENEWIATHMVDFYNNISLLYGLVANDCTSITCPTMTAGPKYEYLWADAKNPKPVRVSAPEYCDNLMKQVETMISDENLFPTSVDRPFPKNFKAEVKPAFKRLVRIFAHIYYHHFEQITALEAEAHLNTSLKHFVFFTAEFGLVERKEFAPLEALVNTFCQNVWDKNAITSNAAGSATASTNPN